MAKSEQIKVKSGQSRGNAGWEGGNNEIHCALSQKPWTYTGYIITAGETNKICLPSVFPSSLV